MADTTIRDKIITQVITDLKKIKKSDGYNHTWRTVEELKDVMPSSPTTPALYVVEGMERANENDAIGYLRKDLNFAVTFLMRDASNPGQTARKMLEDVIKAVSVDMTITDAQSRSTYVNVVEVSNIYIYEKQTSIIHLGVEFRATYKHQLQDSTLS